MLILSKTTGKSEAWLYIFTDSDHYGKKRNKYSNTSYFLNLIVIAHER